MSRDSDTTRLIPLYLQELFSEKTDKYNYIKMTDIKHFLADKGIYANRHTIYSAIHLLEYIGYDIEGRPTQGNYEYHLVSRTFDNNELKFLIDSVAASKFLTTRKSRELINKIKTLGCTKSANKLNRDILVSDRIKSMNDKVLKNLDIIYESLNNNCQISFDYMRWNPQRKLVSTNLNEPHIISPYAVCLNDNNYYLVSYNSKYEELRHYRIDKMRSIKILPIEREGMQLFRDFNLAEYSRKTFNMYGGREENISLRCKDSLVGVFIDRFGDSVSIRPDYENTGYSICKFDVNVSPQFYSWIFALGTDVTILQPQSAIDEFREMTKTVLENYNRNDR